MIIIKIIYLIGGICLILGGLIYLFFRHQQRLKARAFLMREAVRNGDYAFRLPTSGLLPGEKPCSRHSTTCRAILPAS